MITLDRSKLLLLGEHVRMLFLVLGHETLQFILEL